MGATLDDILNSHRTGRSVVMGVLNVTPDSFSDGGRFMDPAAAVEQARRMAAEGADVIDIGAESTRPGCDRVPDNEQIARLREVLPEVCELDVLVSIDTTLAKVARFALNCGASIINDISAGRDDPEMFELAAGSEVALVLMHMLGEPQTMQADPRYGDVIAEVREFLIDQMSAAVKVGVDERRIILDPGLGFGKKIGHNLALLAEIGEFVKMGRPVLVGPSRKRFIGEVAGQPEAARRVGGTIAACLAARCGGATIFRVHDVGELVAALRVDEAISAVQS